MKYYVILTAVSSQKKYCYESSVMCDGKRKAGSKFQDVVERGECCGDTGSWGMSGNSDKRSCDFCSKVKINGKQCEYTN
jgi:hypothetical protein